MAGATSSQPSRADSASTSRAPCVTDTHSSQSAADSPGTAAGSAKPAAPSAANALPAAPALRSAGIHWPWPSTELPLARDLLGESLVALKLFGSHARGTAAPDSDLEVLVRVDVEYFKVEEGAARTATLLRDPEVAVIYEGFFVFDDVVVRPDILVRTRGNHWRLIEVKSTVPARPEHRDDFAIQAYVVTGAGLTLEDACLMHVNTGYLYPGGAYDLQQLFHEEDLIREVRDRQPDIPARLPRPCGPRRSDRRRDPGRFSLTTDPAAGEGRCRVDRPQAPGGPGDGGVPGPPLLMLVIDARSWQRSS